MTLSLGRLGDGGHGGGRQLAPGARAPDLGGAGGGGGARGGSALSRPAAAAAGGGAGGGLLLAAALLLLAQGDGDVLALAQGLLAAHGLDGLVGEVAHGRGEERRGRARAVVVVVGRGRLLGGGEGAGDGGDRGLSEELEVLVRDVRRRARHLLAGGGGRRGRGAERFAPRPAGEGAAGVEVGGRAVGAAPRWDVHGGREGAIRAV